MPQRQLNCLFSLTAAASEGRNGTRWGGGSQNSKTERALHPGRELCGEGSRPRHGSGPQVHSSLLFFAWSQGSGNSIPRGANEKYPADHGQAWLTGCLLSGASSAGTWVPSDTCPLFGTQESWFTALTFFALDSSELKGCQHRDRVLGEKQSFFQESLLEAAPVGNMHAHARACSQLFRTEFLSKIIIIKCPFGPCNKHYGVQGHWLVSCPESAWCPDSMVTRGARLGSDPKHDCC